MEATQHGVAGGDAGKHFAPYLAGCLGIHVKGHGPVGVAREQRGHVGQVCHIEEVLACRLQFKQRMAWRVAICGYRLDARRHFVARFKPHQRVGWHGGKGAARVLERALHAGRGRRHARIVHPEGVFRRRHHHLGLGEGPFARLVAQPVDVVPMEVADEHGVDVRSLHASGTQAVEQLAGGGAAKLAQPGIDEDLARPRHHQERGVGHVDVVGGQVLRCEQRTHFGQRCVLHKLFAQGAARDAVVQCNHFHIAHLHAPEAWAGQGGRTKVGGVLSPDGHERACSVNGGGQACAQEVTA